MNILQKGTIAVKVILLGCIIAVLLSSFSSPKDSNVAFEDVWSAMVQDVDISGLEEKDNKSIKRFLGLDPSNYESIRYFKSTDDMKADELVLVKFKSHDDQEAFQTAMESHIEDREDVFGGYAPDEEDLLEHSILYIQANYGLFVVNANAETIYNQFKAGIEG